MRTRNRVVVRRVNKLYVSMYARVHINAMLRSSEVTTLPRGSPLIGRGSTRVHRGSLSSTRPKRNPAPRSPPGVFVKAARPAEFSDYRRPGRFVCAPNYRNDGAPGRPPVKKPSVSFVETRTEHQRRLSLRALRPFLSLSLSFSLASRSVSKRVGRKRSGDATITDAGPMRSTSPIRSIISRRCLLFSLPFFSSRHLHHGPLRHLVDATMFLFSLSPFFSKIPFLASSSPRNDRRRGERISTHHER